jgi:threonyl-tRNA synthetase
MAFLIEHFAGNFPLWISPEQVAVIPIAETHNDKAQEVFELLKSANIRATIDTSKDGFGKKVRAAKKDRLPYFIIIGDKDIEADMVTLESRDIGNLGQMKIEDVLKRLQEEIANKKLPEVK